MVVVSGVEDVLGPGVFKQPVRVTSSVSGPLLLNSVGALLMAWRHQSPTTLKVVAAGLISSLSLMKDSRVALIAGSSVSVGKTPDTAILTA